MEKFEHLPLAPYQGEVQRQTRGGGGGYKLPEGRNKSDFTRETTNNVDNIINTFGAVKTKYNGIINPSLIFELEINQSVDYKSIEQIMSSMGIHILSSAENKKGYWVVFGDDENLHEFKRKLATYSSEDGPKYDFFNSFGNLRDIPREEKIGERLTKQPLRDAFEYVDIELWRMADEKKNIAFIDGLKAAYPDPSKFLITDQLIAKSFVLLRVKLSKKEFDEIIDFKEISRIDRPSLPTFNPFEINNLDILEIERNAPDENAAGILIIDSGIVSNHPLLEKCIGGEDNFQSGERATHDTVGHGTSVAGCAVYGDIEKCNIDKVFTPSNWIFSAKIMYSATNPINGEKYASYDPEKLIEHQLSEAIVTFLSNSDYHIRVVNLSFGNSQEVWHKTYTRQLPLAALIDELAYTFPYVVFIVSTGNQHPLNLDEFDTIGKIQSNYPKYLIKNPNFKLINPATSALAITVGSISDAVRIQQNRYAEDQIKTAIADENQPSPFTRTGPGINYMVKPELVDYGGNLILFNNHGRISEDIGGKLILLNNNVSTDLFKFDYGTSFSAPKVARIAGQIANKYPQRTANFIINMLLSGAELPFIPKDNFYGSKNGKALEDHLNVCGYGLPSLERAINSFNNRVILFDEGKIQLNRVKVYSLQLPDVFFNEAGHKRIIVNLSFTPETRSTRGDSYLGNRMEFHMFHSVNPQELVNKFGIVSAESEGEEVPAELKKFELKLSPGPRKRNAGCHQKAWKEFKREPRNLPASPVSLVLINYNKWMNDENIQTDYCLSVTFEHEKEIDLYNQIRTNIQTRARVR